MRNRQDAGDDAERAVVFAAVHNGIEMRSDQQPLAVAVAAAHRAERVFAHCQARVLHPARDQIGGAAVLGAEKQPHQPAGFGGDRAEFGDHRLGLLTERYGIGCCHDSHSTLIAVSIIAWQLMTMCMMMVSAVEPLAQRNQPSIRPIVKICAMPSQSYWMCRSAQTSAITAMAGHSQPGRTSAR